MNAGRLQPRAYRLVTQQCWPASKVPCTACHSTDCAPHLRRLHHGGCGVGRPGCQVQGGGQQVRAGWVVCAQQTCKGPNTIPHPPSVLPTHAAAWSSWGGRSSRWQRRAPCTSWCERQQQAAKRLAHAIEVHSSPPACVLRVQQTRAPLVRNMATASSYIKQQVNQWDAEPSKQGGKAPGKSKQLKSGCGRRY